MFIYLKNQQQNRLKFKDNQGLFFKKQMSDKPIDPSTEHQNKHDELGHIMVLCKSGDKQAFSDLYRKTSARLNGIAYRITRNVDSANEVLQEAFIQIWQNRTQYQEDNNNAFAWLAAIVRYRAYDRLRYDKRRHQQDTVEYNEADLLEQQLIEIEQYSQSIGLAEHSEQALNKCLAKLEQKQSQSILMAYLYGYSREEISQHFDAPLSTIKSWIRRGLGRLQLCLNN